jgi:hypothetical protein
LELESIPGPLKSLQIRALDVLLVELFSSGSHTAGKAAKFKMADYYKTGSYPRTPRRGRSAGGSPESCDRRDRDPGCPSAGSSLEPVLVTKLV